ncbi:MAG: flavin reductase family protein [Actinobacteria bacterium]|nr:flavin reductase family protein [Actinomycetota bacterium]
MKRSLGPKTVLYPTPVLVVGTYDAEGRPNVSTAAWGGICCSRPPCVTVSFRAATLAHGNITLKKAFTVNVPAERHVREADYFGVESGRDADKLEVAGLTPVRSVSVDAPYVDEFPLVLECRVVQVHELGLHTQFIGEIVDVKVEEGCLDETGTIDAGRIAPLFYAPVDCHYYGGAKRVAKAFSVGRELKPE